MCDCAGHKTNCRKEEEGKRYHLSDFFNAHWDKYVKECTTPISKEQFKAARAIQICRTAVLGIDYYACPSCGEVVEVYHNCRNRFCPTCSWSDTVKWASRLNEQLLDLPHRHVVFTLPHLLIGLIKRNKRKLLNTLLRTASSTLKEWAVHKHGLKIGIVSVLHTFGETKEYHTHVHMLVSWGGIDPKTGELKSINGEHVNYKFLKQKFRIKFEDELFRLFRNGELKHSFADIFGLKRFIKQINSKSWSIHLEPPMPTASGVIRYIGRYSKRACLSERKITEIDGEYISFRYKDYKTIGPDHKPVERILRLHYRDFFPRLLQHVPESYFSVVRYYGLYANRHHIPEAYKNHSSGSDEEGEWEWQNPFECSFCQKKRVYLYTIIDIRTREERITSFDPGVHESYVFRRA